MGLTAAAFAAALDALRPRGPVWSEDPETPLRRLLDGLAVEHSRVAGRAEDLREEAQPATTDELLEDWERVAGLPDACAIIPTTLEERRAALIARLSEIGQPTPAALAAAIEAATGVEVEIEEIVMPYIGVVDCESPVYGDDWAHTFYVHAGPTTVTELSCEDAPGPLASWGDPRIDCVVNRLKPAHTRALITYEV
ncbi:MAG: DUF2313 domain-containing protein [Planctomycetaceae bacterium]|nr:DUF2313 domain-containing protein [Planctomycetaceae bacterium]